MNLLLEWENDNPDSSSEFSRTPLLRATENYHLKLQLGRTDVNSGGLGGFGRTPLSRVAENYHPELQLGRGDVNSGGLGGYGRTLLSRAADKDEGIVKLLLEWENESRIGQMLVKAFQHSSVSNPRGARDSRHRW